MLASLRTPLPVWLALTVALGASHAHAQADAGTEGEAPPEARQGTADDRGTPAQERERDSAAARQGEGESERDRELRDADEDAGRDESAGEDESMGDRESEGDRRIEGRREREDDREDRDEVGDPDGSESAGGSEGEGDDDEEGLSLGGRVGGEYRHRFVMMSDVPLEPLPRTDPARTGELGQNFWGEQWLRLRGEVTLRPILRLAGEFDVLWGVAYGDLALGQSPAAWPRDTYGYPGLRLRQLYLEWLTPIGLLRVGQMAFSWGLGILSNGGSDPPVFGDYRYGDLVRRVLFATRPAGSDSPFTIAVAGDWVAWDLTADFEGRGDLAFQGVLAAFYEREEDRFGGYVAYRHQTNPLDDYLEVFVADLFAHVHFAEPSGGRILATFELAYVRGTTTYTRTVENPTQDVEQLLFVARLGREHPQLDVMIEGGYASGDSNAEDAIQRRGTMDPDHRVGLVLFPEVLAAQSARSAHLASSPELFGRPARGAELLPTNGGVSGAYYLFPYVIWRPLTWLEARAGAVLAWASADVVDPFAQRARSQSVNYRGGDPARRDLGLELDGALLAHGPIAEGVELGGGFEGGVLFPGRAFDDAAGNPLGPIGLLRLRLGIRY